MNRSPNKCFRNACSSRNAVCRHSQTGHMYCPACRLAINANNPGHPNLVLPAPRPEDAAIDARAEAAELLSLHTAGLPLV